MAWTIEYSRGSQRELAKLDKQTARRIVDFMEQRVAVADDPRQLGQPLAGKMSHYWRYRIGDYRILCEHVGQRFVVLVLKVGHRRDVYR